MPLLSVIVPAYNEEARLPRMLEPALAYLSDPRCEALEHLRRHHRHQHQQLRQQNLSGSEDHVDPSPCHPHELNQSQNQTVVVVEWIVVSDGSTDGTEQAYRDFCQRQPQQVLPQQPVLPHHSTSPREDDDGASNDRGSAPAGRSERIIGNSDDCREDAVATLMQWKFLRLPRNRGKGGAVREGMVASTGLYRLMVDADGATQFDDLSKLTSALLLQSQSSSSSLSSETAPNRRRGAATVWGSRAHLQDSSGEKRSQRSLPRQVLMKSFHAFVKLLCTRRDSPYIRDTQCGFKLFPRREALQLFSNLHLSGWAFDTELLILSSFLKVPILEVAVNWHEVDGSKLSTSALNVLLVSASMLRDMICVRLCYESGVWKIHPEGGGSSAPDEGVANGESRPWSGGTSRFKSE